MLKIVVFDGGYGGELFADMLEEEIPVIEVIRVIDWRNAEALNQTAKTARQAAEKALQPYIGKVDLIVFANHLLSITSLKYFRRKYANQKYLGFKLESPTGAQKRDYLVLTTRPVARTLKFRWFAWRLKSKVKTLQLDEWPRLIDDGELGQFEVAEALELAAIARNKPRDIVLACAAFRDVRGELNGYFKHKVKVYDGFEEAIKAACRMLKIRGGIGRK